MNERRSSSYALLVLIFFSNLALARNHSNKTFLSTRALGADPTIAYNIGLKNGCSNSSIKKVTTHVQVAGFYQGSTNHNALGQYFGIGNGKNSFIVGDSAAVAAGTADILNGLLIHNVLDGPLAGTVSFKPRQKIWGIHVNYFRDIKCPLASLFFKVHLPLLWTENSMNLHVAHSITSGANPDFSLEDFFAGRVEQKDLGSDDLQSKLTKAKINRPQKEFGVGDIDLELGYKYIHTHTKHLFFTVGLTMPTGTRAQGDYLFQPICGNSQHLGFGPSLSTGTEVWCNHHASLKLLVTADYRYLFAKTEKRTIGVKDRPLGHYFLAGRIGQVDEPLFPAANILTTRVRVTPGSQLTTLLALSCNYKQITLDIGHSMFCRTNEHVSLKNWNDNIFVLASPDYSTAGPLDPATGGALQTLNKADLDIAAAATPMLFTNTLFVTADYTGCITKKYPVSIGIGGSYEFGSSNADIENYAVWLKVMVSC